MDVLATFNVGDLAFYHDKDELEELRVNFFQEG